MAASSHILIVESPYYREICDELARGAVAALEAAGASYERIEVPGAFEIPAAIAMAMGPAYDGYLALGCVLRGETSHYDYICGESARKLQDLASDHHLALGYGILTCENAEQARVRAQADGKDKGGDAARTCLRMIEVKRHFGKPAP